MRAADTKQLHIVRGVGSRHHRGTRGKLLERIEVTGLNIGKADTTEAP